VFDPQENQDKWDRRFLALAEQVASWSKDPSTKIGAVLVDPDRRIVGTGYNGFPRGVEDTEERLNDRPLKYSLVVHAEVNAIISAGDRALGGTLYVVPTLMVPNICPECAKIAVQAGIAEVVGWASNETVAERWQQFAASTKILLEEGYVRYRAVRR
jgi:dCMP deaminase